MDNLHELIRVKNARARIHEAQARLKLEEQYYIDELLKLAQRGGERHGERHPQRSDQVQPRRSE